MKPERKKVRDYERKGKKEVFARRESENGLMLTVRMPLWTMLLHVNVSVQMVQSAVRLLAAIPATLVHALNLLIAAPRALVLLRARNRHERVDGGQRVASLQFQVSNAPLSNDQTPAQT